VFLFILALLLVGCESQDDTQQNMDIVNETEEALIGEDPVEDREEIDERIPAIDFTLTDGQGNEVSISDYKGKVVFVNFWGTWCEYCVKEMPLLQETYEAYKDDIEILAINVQTIPREKSVEEVLEWVDELGLTFPILFDMDGSVSNEYYITAFPTTYVVDREGYFLGYIPGAIDEEMMKQIIDEIL
jgi:cytochrome c-type biogenesis protein